MDFFFFFQHSDDGIDKEQKGEEELFSHEQSKR